MKAIVHDGYGSPDVLSLADIAAPLPSADEVLVEVRAASVNPYDWHLLTGLPYIARAQFGLRRPKQRRLGADVAGRVLAVGADVTRFRPGDDVYGDAQQGSFAEQVCVAEPKLVEKPSNLSFEEAAAVPMAALTALQGLRDHGRVEAGRSVLINGASGGVGTFAVQIAAWMGADVTGVCSGRNADLVRSLGAHHVIDYTHEDLVHSGRRFDVVLDNVGNHSVSEFRRLLHRDGTYIASYGQPDHRWLGPMVQLLRMYMMSPFVSQSLTTFVAATDAEDLATLTELLAAGDLTPVIDRTFPLVEVADAIRYLEQGHARGKVVVTV
jgi:NADPH:quinone reductase-like Zn-dependent oxidoreductase